MTQPLVVSLHTHVISGVTVYSLPSFIHNLENIKDIEYFDLHPPSTEHKLPRYVCCTCRCEHTSPVLKATDKYFPGWHFARTVFNTVVGLANRVGKRWRLKIVPLSAERLYPLATVKRVEQRYTGPLLTQVETSSSYQSKVNGAEDIRYNSYYKRPLRSHCYVCAPQKHPRQNRH